MAADDMTRLKWPFLPKARWQNILASGGNASGRDPRFVLPDGVHMQVGATLAQPFDALDAALRKQPAWSITVPDNWHGGQSLDLAADAVSGCVVQIHVGAGATVHIREDWRGQNATQLHVLIRLDIAAGATVRYDTLDILRGSVAVYRHVRMADNTELNWHAATFGECSGGIQHTVDLNGTGAKAKVNMAALAGGDANLYVTTTVNNKGRRTQGLINQHGVLTGDAKMVLTGVGAIVRGARGSDAQQENRVLMLSDGAVGEANPLLLIDENDVTAGHAASVAAVDAQQLYYLMSRGLPKTVALRLVVRGFLLSLLPDDLAKSKRLAVQQVIEEQLIAGDKA